ncbi:MAG: IPT/TIG domain-containing protein, partial [Alicyclobacillus macrosporangiidus]|nr:IPT/TIG domain-containing protein [Alicyclobacillus macrosporangiidus]
MILTDGAGHYRATTFEAALPHAFSTANFIVAEDGGSAIITVDRSGGSDGVVSVAYATYDGTAKAGSDYTDTTGVLSFNDGETSKSFTVPILDNGVHEGYRTINLTLSNPTGGVTLGTRNTATLTINDNEIASRIIYDDFNDNQIDSSKWSVGNDPNTNVEEINGRLELSISPNASGTAFAAGISSLCAVSGDYDIEVEYSLLTWPNGNGVRLGLGTTASCMERTSLGTGQEAYLTDSDSLGHGPVVWTNDQNGKLRIKRTGSTVTGYYYSNEISGWVEAGTYSNTNPGPTTFVLQIWSHDGIFAPQGSEIRVALDNISVVGKIVVIPSVTGITPVSGPMAGGTTVNITGTGFTGATAVMFGSTAATNFTVNSDTSITATSPAGTGTVDVTVTGPGGTSATVPGDRFTYQYVPGWLGQYFYGEDLTNLRLTRVDPQINFDWGYNGYLSPLGAGNPFSVRWTGYVVPEVSGDYIFATYSDDGVRLWVDNGLVIDNWTYHGPAYNYSNPVHLEAGQAYSVK